MHVNNEIGVIQDLAAIGELCRARKILFHVDAAQSAGKIDIDVDAMKIDLLSLSAHKVYGPKGIATKFEDTMAQLGDRPKVRIIRMRKVPFIDSTGIHNLTVLCEMSQKEKTTVILSGVNDKVHKVLEKSGFYELLGKENICPNINIALERAESIVK
jgi:anti-anti-sigma factor